MKGIGSLVLAATLGAAAPHAAAAKLSDLTLGTQVFGPKITKADLVGRIVVYEFWGHR